MRRSIDRQHDDPVVTGNIRTLLR